MESIKRLVQSEFEKFEKNCKQRLCKKEEEGTIGRIVSFVSCKVSNRNSKMHSSISLYGISSINNEKHSQFQIVQTCNIYSITNLNIQMIILF